ncbi:hypothetical protein AMK59_7718 [Oryctes borbonicus]|uniref:SAP domain-containing protein n=1 Tax=Oryctes borbonicus TaxID=1629725 RepID=A0A0T6AXR0_9SCAR|nr:hypothetical protein AMK59_7718 [Oryctes borbonicus]
MSAELDPAKLKVVELRSELSARGLDTKGNKPVLVKRLKDALEKELKKELPDTSIADTSTEDLNTSQTEESETSKEEEQRNAPVADDKKEVTKTPEKEIKCQESSVKEVDNKIKREEPVERRISEELDKDTEEPAAKKPKIEHTPEKKMSEDETEVDKDEEIKSALIKKEDIKQEETTKVDEEEASKSVPEDSALVKLEENGVKMENIVETESKDSVENIEEPMETGESECAESKLPDKKGETKDSPQRGDKRKRSPSPNRSQRRRSRSPIKEDEPVIDNSKVQLNWYDSDLHLQIDKESFLSGKPYHDGAFGYIWSGTRATHGADTGKVCYEVKITEELKWEDFIRQPDRGRRDRERKEPRRDRSERRDKSSDKKKVVDKKDSRHKDKSKEEKGNEDSHEKPEEADIAKEEDKTQRIGEEKELMECESKVEEKQEDASQESNSAEATEDTKIETSQEDASSQKEEKADETMEVDETKGDEKTEEKKGESDNKQETEKEEKKESKETEVITPISSHLIRIGWSSLNSGLQLGESKFSYGYESSGKFVHDKNFVDYGKPFAVGDVIGAYLDFSEEAVNIRYTLNGEELPVAFTIPKTEVPEENFSLFPHVLSRNYAFEVNLGGKDEPFFSHPESLSDYVYIDKFENKVSGPTRPETRGDCEVIMMCGLRGDCEVIMMCGLPASGKTHWVNEHVANNPDKRYTVIGNTQLLEKMTVNGNPLKNSLKGRWNIVLEKLSKCLNKLVEIAALRRRNYVIDQRTCHYQR